MSVAKARAAALVGPNDPPRLQFLKSATEANGIGFFAPTPHAARHPPARRLSICFNDSQPGGPVRINHTLARTSKPVAAIVRPQARRPQSRQALRIVRPQRHNMNLENAASTQRRKGAETRVFHEKDRRTRKVDRNEIRD
jgi:hypothetical protein